MSLFSNISVAVRIKMFYTIKCWILYHFVEGYYCD